MIHPFGMLLLIVASRLSAQVTAIEHVTVIDGTGVPARLDQTIVVEGRTIAAVGPSATTRAPAGARRIDGRGKYVIPGLIDVHAHTDFGPVFIDTTGGRREMRMEYDVTASREMLGTLLAFGITTARNPGGPTDRVVATRDSLRAGRLLGPRLFTAGDVIDLINAPGLTIGVKTESDVRAEVARQAAAGVDYVKLYASLGPAMIRAGIDEAHQHGVKAIAHLMFTTWTDAANAGIDGIVHVIPGSPALLPAAKRAAFLKSMMGTQFMYAWFKYVDLESPEFNDMVDALVKHQVWLDPTLVVFEAMVRGDDSSLTAGPDMALVPPALLHNWQHDMQLSLGWSAADFADGRRTWPLIQRFVKHLYDRGVLLTAGTDVPNPWVPPGASFHRELELLVACGIPPLDVISIATRNGARSLGIDAETGTLEVGKRGDLVLLNANPLADIRNSRRVALVMQRGTLLHPRSLLPARARHLAEHE